MGIQLYISRQIIILSHTILNFTKGNRLYYIFIHNVCNFFPIKIDKNLLGYKKEIKKSLKIALIDNLKRKIKLKQAYFLHYLKGKSG